MPSKAEAEKKHAIRRARERYRLALTDEDYTYLVNCIRKQGQKNRQRMPVELVERQSNRVSLYDIIFPTVVLRTVYDHARGRIVTFLPPYSTDVSLS